MHPTFALRVIAILLLLSTSSFIRHREKAGHLPLHGGCITTEDQYLLYGYTADPINATTATDGVTGAYAYQWQSSTDNIHFTDLPGATSQNLGFISPLAQTTYFQRKTISGAEVAYTGKAMVLMTSTQYWNVAKSGNFIRNNCATGGAGSTVTYTVPANTYWSAKNQADADAKAQNDVNNNGQNNANTNGYCTWYNSPQYGFFEKNDCPESAVRGSEEQYIVYANTYSSTISQDDANQKAVNAVNANGQGYANSIGRCLYNSQDMSGYYYNQNCYEGGGSPYYVYMPYGMYSSWVSQDDADNMARNDAQQQANTYATCGVDIYCDSYTADFAEFYNVNTGQIYYFNISQGYIGTIPEGTYTVMFYGDGNYHTYYLNCGYSAWGYYNTTLYSVPINSNCHTFTIY